MGKLIKKTLPISLDTLEPKFNFAKPLLVFPYLNYIVNKP
jgi:hypothetical protein